MIRLLIGIIICCTQSLCAQDFQGIATYATNRKVEIKLDSTKVNSEMQKQFQELMRKQFQKEYTLTFDKVISVYKEEESLGAPQPGGGGIQVFISGSGTSDIVYKNSKEKQFVAQRDILGKIFLVKDSLTEYHWELIDETKKIGNYTCYKALSKRTIKRTQSVSINHETKENQESEEDEIIITVWYTPEIPISHGPGPYWGLPGLILEVTDGEQSILCNKIVLNPKKKITIEAPHKGKVVTESKFEEIVQKRVEEMQNQRSHRSDGNNVEIRIGG